MKTSAYIHITATLLASLGLGGGGSRAFAQDSPAAPASGEAPVAPAAPAQAPREVAPDAQQPDGPQVEGAAAPPRSPDAPPPQPGEPQAAEPQATGEQAAELQAAGQQAVGQPSAQSGSVPAPTEAEVAEGEDLDAPAAAASPPDGPADEPVAPVREHPVDNAATRFRLGKGLAFESEDGDFSMVPRLRAQFLYGAVAPETGSAEQSFQIRRARLQFVGNFWGEHNQYKAEFALSPRDVATRDTGPGTSILLDWYLDFTHLRDLNLRVGQYKVPFNRQRVISSGDLQLVDRSIVNGEFTVDRDLGFDLRSEDLFGLGVLKYYLGVFIGEGRNTFAPSDFGNMYLARLEFLPLGDFVDYKEADLERTPSPKISIGLGAGYVDRAKRDRGILGSTPADEGTTDVSLLLADVMFKYEGLSVFSEMIARNGERTPGDATVEDDTGAAQPVATASPRDGYGAMVQAGYVLPQTSFEIVGRVGMVEPLGSQSALPPQREYGGGLNYYFAHHPFKLQLDYFLLSEGDGPAAFSEHQVRLQLQAAY